MQQTRQVRIFADLASLFASRPADSELARLEDDFTFHWVDGAMPDQQWATFENDPFDPTSTRPSKLAALAKFELLRHCHFSQPLPMAGGRSLYDHIRMHTRHVPFRLDSGSSSAGGGHMSLARELSQWSQVAGDPQWTPHPYVCSTCIRSRCWCTRAGTTGWGSPPTRAASAGAAAPARPVGWISCSRAGAATPRRRRTSCGWSGTGGTTRRR